MDPELEEVVFLFQCLNFEEVTYDPEYIAKYAEVKKIKKEDWPGRSSPPPWVGFGYNKSYELMYAGCSSVPGLNLNFGRLNVMRIEKIINPFLERAYELKKLKSKIHTEKIVFHATTPETVGSICINNFNWRFNGKSRGHKHGRGVSFSPRPKFADQFCKSVYDRRIIITKILLGTSHVGNRNHDLPMDGFDTTTSPNGNVCVKFEDSEFLPMYVVHYYM